MEPKKRALLAGCGYVGQALARQLLALDWQVDAIRRTAGTPLAAVHWISLDLCNPVTLEATYDVVFYLVAADAYDEVHYDNAYRRGVENLLAALEKSIPLPLFVFVSSTSVYAQDQGEWVDENSPVCDATFASKALLAGEQLALTSAVPALVVRFSGIYGPGRTRFLESIQSQQVGLMEPTFYTNRIHLEDCVGSLLHLATHGKACETYLATDSFPSDHNETVTWVNQKLGRVPADLITKGAPSPHRSNKRCSNDKLIASGYVFHVPSYQQGWDFLLSV